MSTTGAEKEIPADMEATSNVEGEEPDSASDDLKKPSYDQLPHDEKLERFPLRYTRFPMWGGQDVYFNWFTSILGFGSLWGLAIWCMATPDAAFETLTSWQAAVTLKFTWFYIVANPVFTFFTFWLAFRYGDVKLGKKDEPPEFSEGSYFMMLFSAGIAVGLFVSL